MFATLAAASYYFVAWAQDEQLRDLVLSALATFLATIARYDGWALYLAIMAMLLVICWRKRYPRDKTVAQVILFGTLGGVGIVGWFAWNLVIFGSPTAFLTGSFSSQAQTQSFIQQGYADTYHSLWQSLRTYSLATAESLGPVLFALVVAAVVVFLIRRRLSSDALAALTILVPFAFYVVAFFLGQDVMYIPYANHPPYYLYNARFGAEMAAPAAIFIATLVEAAQRWHPLVRVAPLTRLALLGAVIGQSVAISWGGVISLQDGQVGASCYFGHPTAAYLAQHYDGSRILIDEYHTQIDLSAADIPFHDEIYEGDGVIWEDALQNPTKYVEWVVAAPNDLVSQHIDTQSLAFRREYAPVATDPATDATLWHRISAASLPNRPLPQSVISPYLACNRAKDVPVARATGSAGAPAIENGTALIEARQRIAAARLSLVRAGSES